jgi:hypothetical protein
MSYDNYLSEYAKIGYGPHGVIVLNNFISDSDRDELIKYIEDASAVGTIHQEEIDSQHILSIMRGHEVRAYDAVKDNYVDRYGVAVKSTPRNAAHLTNWDMLIGFEMPIHNDSETPSGGPAILGGFYQYNITSITYLTDDYVGGNISFPEFDLTLYPKAGDMVLFPSRYRHKILKFESGRRYTMPMFFTFDIEDTIDPKLTEITGDINPSDVLFFEDK